MPPGFDRGVLFDDDGVTLKSSTENLSIECPVLKNPDNVNLMDLIKHEQDFLGKCTHFYVINLKI